jgi:hypothetical protein
LEKGRKKYGGGRVEVLCCSSVESIEEEERSIVGCCGNFVFWKFSRWKGLEKGRKKYGGGGVEVLYCRIIRRRRRRKKY